MTDNPYLNRSVDDLAMSVRVARCMQQLGVTTVGEMAQKTTVELLHEPNFGAASLHEVMLLLEAMGLRLRDVDTRNS